MNETESRICPGIYYNSLVLTWDSYPIEEIRDFVLSSEEYDDEDDLANHVQAQLDFEADFDINEIQKEIEKLGLDKVILADEDYQDEYSYYAACRWFVYDEKLYKEESYINNTLATYMKPVWTEYAQILKKIGLKSQEFEYCNKDAVEALCENSDDNDYEDAAEAFLDKVWGYNIWHKGEQYSELSESKLNTLMEVTSAFMSKYAEACVDCLKKTIEKLKDETRITS